MNKRWTTTTVAFNRFAAIDFEIADYSYDSACAISVVVIEKGNIIKNISDFIQPPRRSFIFSYLHGITWKDVAKKPKFEELWPKINNILEDVEFIAAHNAVFDRAVLNSCCAMVGIAPLNIPYLCTVKLSRHLWGIYPTKLSDVCRHFNILHTHHNAESDAIVCAKIVLKASVYGLPVDAFLAEVNMAHEKYYNRNIF